MLGSPSPCFAPFPSTDHSLLPDSAAGDIFQVRSVANLVPPFQKDAATHDTSAALEFAVNHLKARARVCACGTAIPGISLPGRVGALGTSVCPE